MHGSHALNAHGRPGAGPAIALSFVLVAFVCAFAGLCYAELASMIPIAGSAYTYTYATLGELVAWIIGWDLILEYAVSNMAVAVGFSAYIKSLFQTYGINIPDSISTPAYQPGVGWAFNFNLLGFLTVMILTVLLVVGVKESAGANNVMVGVKLVALVVFIVAASHYIRPVNYHPYFPNGWQGVLTGGAIVFFSYIGFDSVSTAAEECRNPKRDLPIGILCSLFVCAIFYVGVAVVLTGIQPWRTLNNAAPVANALHAIGLNTVERWVTVGALDGHDFLVAGVSIWAGACMVRHVARWPAASQLLLGPQALSHAVCRHMGGRSFRGNSRGYIRHWHAGEPLQYRNAFRVYTGGHRRTDTQKDAARPPAGLPRPLFPVGSADVFGDVLHSNGQPHR